MLPARPVVSVHLRPGVITPGSSFEAIVRLESRRRLAISSVDCRFSGDMTITSGGVVTNATRVVDLHATASPKELPAGPSELRVRFAVPAHAPPSYSGTTMQCDYRLRVYVDIPWWLDRETTFSIPVTAGPGDAVAQGELTKLTLHDSGLQTECAIDRTVVTPGGVIAGRVAFLGVAGSGLRDVRIRLRCLEMHEREVFDGRNYVVEVPIDRHIDGDAHTFRVKMPEDAVPSFWFGVFGTRWRLELEADTKLGHSALLGFDINVVAKQTVGLDFFAELPLVGDQRRSQMLSRIARRTGLFHEVTTDRLVGDRDGVSLTLERDAATGCNRIELRWRPLAINLAVSAARWNDALSPNEINVGVPEFDKRFQVRGREAPQVNAALEPFLLAHTFIATLSECTIRDDGATLVAPAQHAEEALMGIAYDASAIARRVRAVIETLPPPAHFADVADAWRALAARYRGRFRVGDCALLDLELLTERVSIVHTFVGAKVRETVVRVPFDPALTAVPNRAKPETIRADWREPLAGIEASGGAWTASENALEVRVAPLREAVEAERWIERAVAVARVLQGRRDTGPFR